MFNAVIFIQGKTLLTDCFSAMSIQSTIKDIKYTFTHFSSQNVSDIQKIKVSCGILWYPAVSCGDKSDPFVNVYDLV